eukprot:330355_1
MNIKSSWLRWVFGVIVCSNAISYAVNRYTLIPIQDQLMEWYDINAVQYNLLMSLYSWPNVLCSILFGILNDKFGVRRMLIFAWFIVIIGLSIIIHSSTIQNYFLLCIGRTIVGLGNEALGLSLKVYVLQFFNTNEYGIIFGIYIAAQAIGGGTNTYISYQIYELFGLTYSLAIPLIITPFSIVAILTLMFYEKYKLTNNSSESTKLIIEDEQKKTDGFKLSDMKQFTIYFWILMSGSIFFAGGYQSGLNIGISFIHSMFGFDYQFATIIATFGTVISTCSYLLSGSLSSKFGRRIEMLLISNICLIVGHYIYGWINYNAFWAFFGQFLIRVAAGFNFPIVWSSFPLLVSDDVRGTAFGFVVSFRFLVIGICYIIVGILTDDYDPKYIKVQYFIIGAIVISTIFYIISMYLDVKYNNSVLRKVETKKK